jgi:hypothetical protein
MGVTKTIIREGSGPTPEKGQNITVHCTGYLKEGNKVRRHLMLQALSNPPTIVVL